MSRSSSHYAGCSPYPAVWARRGLRPFGRVVSLQQANKLNEDIDVLTPVSADVENAKSACPSVKSEDAVWMLTVTSNGEATRNSVRSGFGGKAAHTVDAFVALRCDGSGPAATRSPTCRCETPRSCVCYGARSSFSLHTIPASPLSVPQAGCAEAFHRDSVVC